MMRGSRVEVTVLYSVEMRLVEPQQMGLVWLKVLKVSQRNWPVRCSVNLMFLNKDKSVRQKPGPRMAPGRSVVSVICVVGGATQRGGVEPTCPLMIKLGIQRGFRPRRPVAPSAAGVGNPALLSILIY